MTLPDLKKDFKIHPDTLNILRQIQERSVLGVRGNYTAEILNSHGIKNLAVIGCPSLFYNFEGDYKIKSENNKITNVSCNFRSFHSDLTDKEIDFLKFCAAGDFSFCEQTMQPFSPEICKDFEAFKIINRWLDLNKFLFFDINDWKNFSKSRQFSIGSRFHGNVISLWSHKPALFITIDSRTREMTELFKLPSITLEEFNPAIPIEHYYEYADYSDFNNTYPKLLGNFKEFLKKNSLLPAEA